MPEAPSCPLQMSAQIRRQFVPEGQIHGPGQQQLIDGVHQPQTVLVADGITHQTEIKIGSFTMAAHGPGAEQPHLLEPRLL